MRKFRYAGVSKVGGEFHFRASNREAYPQILERNKHTNVNIIDLGKPMEKDKAREVVARRKAFQTPAIRAILKKGDAPAPAKKKATAKKRATRKVASAENTSAAA